jgi:prepilin-type N-terminal cleavage/methylation domain-containing protein
MMHRSDTGKFRKQKGFGLPELLIVVFIIAILCVLALPRVISTRRLSQFNEMQDQVAALLNEARQESVSQKAPVIFRYDNLNKIIVIYNGNFGALGDVANRVVDLSSFGLETPYIIYGRPVGVPESPLTDTSNIINLTENSVEITFQPDGSVIDADNNPQNSALFFYYGKSPQNFAFAVSILSEGGRAKVWQYSKNIKDYIGKK